MAAHARLGASSASRWMNCSGSVQLSEGVPTYTSVYAAEGTKAHTLAEKALRTCSSGTPIVPEHPDHPDMAAAVQVFVDYCCELKENADWYAIEERVSLDKAFYPFTPPEPMFGTADFIAVVGDTLHVVDYKHGSGVAVYAKENIQCIYYGLGALFEIWEKPICKQIKNVKLTIIQPRAANSLKDSVDGWDLSVKSLLAYGHKISKAALRVKNGPVELKTGDWCRFCPALGKCPEAHKQAMEHAKNEFSVVAPPNELSDEDLKAVLDSITFTERFFKEATLEAQRRLEHGRKLSGWKLVKKRAIRQWADDDWRDKVGAQGVDARELKDRTVASVEREFNKKGLTLDPTLYTLPDTGATLVPESDQRPALAAGPEVDFTEVA